MNNIEANAIWNHSDYNKSTYSELGLVAQTTKTIPLGFTASGVDYHVSITARNAVSAGTHFITNKTTTTFDITYTSAITGDLLFDFIVL